MAVPFGTRQRGISQVSLGIQHLKCENLVHLGQVAAPDASVRLLWIQLGSPRRIVPNPWKTNKRQLNEAINSAAAWAHHRLSFLWKHLQVCDTQVKYTGLAYCASTECVLPPKNTQWKESKSSSRGQCLSSFLQCYHWPLLPFGDHGLQSPMFLQADFSQSSLCPLPGCQCALPGKKKTYNS